MFTLKRSLNNRPYDHDAPDHIQHATPRVALISGSSKICDEM